LYFLDPDAIVPPQVPNGPAALVPRARASSHADAEPVHLEAPVTTNPLLCSPTVPTAEIETIRRLSARVNVLPVVARADTLTNDRLAAVKVAVRNDLARAGIGFGIFDSRTEDTMESSVSAARKGYAHANGNGTSPRVSPPVTAPRVPYALISPDIYAHSDGVTQTPPSRHELMEQFAPYPSAHSRPSRLVLGRFTRTYRWGSLDVLDTKHCDFIYLLTAIHAHMEVSPVFMARGNRIDQCGVGIAQVYQRLPVQAVQDGDAGTPSAGSCAPPGHSAEPATAPACGGLAQPADHGNHAPGCGGRPPHVLERCTASYQSGPESGCCQHHGS
jgi:hypothetical protein